MLCVPSKSDPFLLVFSSGGGKPGMVSQLGLSDMELMECLSLLLDHVDSPLCKESTDKLLVRPLVD